MTDFAFLSKPCLQHITKGPCCLLGKLFLIEHISSVFEPTNIKLSKPVYLYLYSTTSLLVFFIVFIRNNSLSIGCFHKMFIGVSTVEVCLCVRSFDGV